jgi:hypothetical protein
MPFREEGDIQRLTMAMLSGFLSFGVILRFPVNRRLGVGERLAYVKEKMMI